MDAPSEAPWHSLLRLIIRHIRPVSVLGFIALVVLGLVLASAPIVWATAATLGIALFLVVAVRPVAGLIVLALVLPFGRIGELPLPGVGAVDLLVLLTTGAWFAAGAGRRQLQFRLPLLAWPAVIMVWVFALSLTQAESWREGVPEWLKWVEFVLVYLVAAQVLGRRDVPWILGSLFLAGLIQAGLGAYQFLWGVGPEAFMIGGRFMRAYGTFSQPNPYAAYLGHLAPAAFSLAIYYVVNWYARQRTRDLAAGLACAVAVLACVAGIGMSWSRGAWMGLAAALLVTLAVRNRRLAALAVATLLVLVLVIGFFGTDWLPDAISGRLAELGSFITPVDPARTEITDENFAILERLAHWEAAWRMFSNQPWLGVGLGNYGQAYANYTLPHWYDALGHAHNVYLNFLAETGLLGTIAFGVFWLAAFAATAWTMQRSGAWKRALAAGVLGTLTYVTVHNMFDNLFVAHLQLQLALLLACLNVKSGTA